MASKVLSREEGRIVCMTILPYHPHLITCSSDSNGHRYRVFVDIPSIHLYDLTRRHDVGARTRRRNW